MNYLTGVFNTVDYNKAYTSNLMDMDYIPVFNVFDVFLQYDNEIENYTQYIVQCNDNNDETAILFGAKISRCYGYKLNKINSINYQISEDHQN